ncbi:nucleoside triphosphate pyrophosphohydrolase [Paraglaciecola sp.]|uniref:nucleoside triphosphate pyrophosphohydrolase n=1 Tax=Paraglaciecola sp. TaxID=1920173 RepID=UPI003EF2FF0B
MADSDNKHPKLQNLLNIMEQLRDPVAGCPWDNKQTFESIIPHTIEETYEVADAILNGDVLDIKDELGDLLFQIVFYAQLAKEQGDFEFEDVAEVISEKLVRRHPHVFSHQKSTSNELLSEQWEAIKTQEREAQGKANDLSVLANIPAGLTPLIRANKLQKKCAKVGFDWPELPPVVDKVYEEIDEVLAELNVQEVDQQAVEEEIGDLLFAVVNLSRHANVNPEVALMKANNKFEKRFRQVEKLMAEQGSDVSKASLQQMETAWVNVKDNE